ncbi:MAG: hypothetical protein OXI57_10160 [Rhodospirillales bacterium]|nr:hypothetical protein [Rhodospirillales bacterium]
MYDDAVRAGGPDPIPNDTDPDCSPAAADADALLAAVGLSSHAIREVLGHPAGAGEGG